MQKFMNFVLKWIAVALTLAISGSCCPARHLSTSHSDTTRVEVREVVRLVTDTVEVQVPVEVQTAIVPDSSHLETSYATSDAYLTAEGQLFHSLSNKAGARPIEVEKEEIERDSIYTRTRHLYEIVEVERDFTKFERFQMTAFWVLSALLIAALVFKFREIIKIP